MVDEYVQAIASLLKHRWVQIPLWSMNTNVWWWFHRLIDVQIPLWSMNTQAVPCREIIQGSDSLWSMIHPATHFSDNIRGSDSSMVDEYPAGFIRCVKLFQFRFLYGRWILFPRWGINGGCSSDYLWSVNTLVLLRLCLPWRIQIPLWSMNTIIFSNMKLKKMEIPLWSMNIKLL